MTIPWMMNCSHAADGWCLDCVVKLGNETSDLRAQLAATQKDAARYRTLKPHYLCVDFAYGDPSEPRTVICFEMPDGGQYGSDLDAVVDAMQPLDAAMEGK